MAAGHGSNSISVFYLTNKLTKEEDEDVKAEFTLLRGFEADYDYELDKQCCFVPWKPGKDGKDDGTLEDMWEIYWMVVVSNQGHFPNPPGPIFFIDYQSGCDRTIIMADCHFYNYDCRSGIPEDLRGVPYPYIQGLTYGRILGRDAHPAFHNINNGPKDFDGYMDEDEKYNFPRPDWPLH